jgi:hypothetical protein
MSSPVYNTAVFRRGHFGGGGRRRRGWRGIIGMGSTRGGNTPAYLGAGQPAIEDDGELTDDGTPAYLTAPPKAAATTPSTTPSGPTSPQPVMVMAPQPTTAATQQPATTAIVVPRS